MDHLGIRKRRHMSRFFPALTAYGHKSPFSAGCLGVTEREIMYVREEPMTGGGTCEAPASLHVTQAMFSVAGGVSSSFFLVV